MLEDSCSTRILLLGPLLYKQSWTSFSSSSVRGLKSSDRSSLGALSDFRSSASFSSCSFTSNPNSPNLRSNRLDPSSASL
uniref:Uncharacterized protein n=1 Tax=Arundo donax TaxID=35708 RepID=A0A0A9GCS2_ARUDO